MSILSIAKTYRNLNRMRKIVQVLTRYGFGHLVVRMNLGRIPVVSAIGRLTDTPPDLSFTQDLAFRTRRVLEELGPTFVKLGQQLSSRPDLVPEEFVDEFRKLRDHVSPFPGETAREIVEKAMDHAFDHVFDRFDDTPVGTGSIGQVHRARFRDGTEVMLKIKRPGIDADIRSDLSLLMILAQLSEDYLPELQVLRPVMLVEEFQRQLDKELDFVTEAAFTALFTESLKEDLQVKTPRVFWEYTSRDVLCIERLEGVSVGNLAKIEEMGVDRTALARDLANVFMFQFFNTGLFHGDPHSGNILVTSDGRLGLIDFGLVGHLTEEIRGQIGTLVLGLIRKDMDLILDVYRELGVVGETTSSRDLKMDILEIVDRYLGIPISGINTGALFLDVMKLGRKHQAQLPRDFVLLGRSLVSVAGVVQELDPDFHIIEVASPHARKLIAEKFSPRQLVNAAFGTGRSLFNLIKNLPSDIGSILRMIRQGSMRVTFRHEGLERAVEEMERSSNRLALSVLLASMVIGSALVAAAKIGPQIEGIPILGAIGFLLTALGGAALAVTILRSGRI